MFGKPFDPKRLQTLFNFTVEDLAYNKQGILSDRQKRRLENSINFRLLIAIVVGVVGGIALVLGEFANQILLIVLIVGAYAIYALYYWYQVQQALTKNEVSSIVGYLTAYNRGINNRDNYIQVGDVSVKVSGRVARAVVGQSIRSVFSFAKLLSTAANADSADPLGGQYCMYYIKSPRRCLSIEKVD